jgi:protein involved in polysaccharide export with SLBB domain
MELLKFIANTLRKWAWLPAMIVLAGCHSVDPMAPLPDANAPGTSMGTNSIDTANYTLRVGDQLTVNFFDITPAIPAITDQIKEDGTITLIYNEKFQAADKTISQLQNDVHARYVPAYVKYMTVNIAPMNRGFTVSGEVRSPNRYGYSGQIRVLEAITTAGGFTDYANKRKVKVTRADHRQIIVNCVKAQDDPDLNIEIFPGDTINVPVTMW